MGQQIIQQPDGNFSIFDSCPDQFCVLDASEGDIVAFFVDQAKKQAEREVSRILQQIKDGEQAYYQFTMTWAAAMHEHRLNAVNSHPDWNTQVEKVAMRLEKSS